MGLFPSLEWFRRLADRMNVQSEKYARLGVVDLTLVVTIYFHRRCERYALTFEGYGCSGVRTLTDSESPTGRHPVILEGQYQVWKDMVENIRLHGAADQAHTLNAMTWHHESLRLLPGSDGGQLDVDRFSRYIVTLQAFFDEAAQVETNLVVAIQPGSATLHELEREIIVNMLTLTRGNQSEAARLLGLRESTLRYRLRKFGIAARRARGRVEGVPEPVPTARRARNV